MSEAFTRTGLTDEGKSGSALCYFEFRNVSKAFDGRPVLNNVSFRVKRGDTCVIMAAAAWASRFR